MRGRLQKPAIVARHDTDGSEVQFEHRYVGSALHTPLRIIPNEPGFIFALGRPGPRGFAFKVINRRERFVVTSDDVPAGSEDQRRIGKRPVVKELPAANDDVDRCSAAAAEIFCVAGPGTGIRPRTYSGNTTG